ncbi:oxygenase MpaB family protein [Nocardia carnea]|uniref:Oxygenase MpaB family protein n=1 Tax=Nocardia carnea TaxID=37328 RepID=A0ABW7TQP4_9NOCA|nr:oxygenase MpaB family protein [Nocardia carnea]
MLPQEPITSPPGRESDLVDTGKRHRFDYYFRPGMPLRPPPPRIAPSGLWFESRKQMLSPWIDIRRVPVQTPQARMMADHLWQGDELMDGVVAAFARVGTAAGRRMLDQALAHGIDTVGEPPAELVALFEHLDNPPGWFDPQRWERGRRLWLNASMSGKTAMLIQDFMGTFVGAEVASATGATGRYVNDPYRRNLETANWFRSMTVAGALDRRSRTFQDTVRVRLMHAQVRAGLKKAWGPDHFARHGNPISNSTMMGAAVTFGLTPLCFDHVHGRRADAEQLDDVMHYWAGIAHVFGVAPELIPATAVEGMRLVDYMVATAGTAPAWTARMAGAATRGFAGDGAVARAKVSAAAPVAGMMAYYSSDVLVRELLAETPLRNVPLQPWKAATGLVSTVEVRARALGDTLPGAQRRLARRARRDDPMWRWQSRIARAAAVRAGIRDTPYDHHDGSADGQLRSIRR